MRRTHVVANNTKQGKELLMLMKSKYSFTPTAFNCYYCHLLLPGYWCYRCWCYFWCCRCRSGNWNSQLAHGALRCVWCTLSHKHIVMKFFCFLKPFIPSRISGRTLGIIGMWFFLSSFLVFPSSLSYLHLLSFCLISVALFCRPGANWYCGGTESESFWTLSYFLWSIYWGIILCNNIRTLWKLRC